jgi:hypothetical protein
MALLIVLGGCARSDAGRQQPVQTEDEGRISGAEARRLVLQQYRQLFSALYLRDDATGKYHAFPPLEEAAFRIVEQRPDGWIIRADPPAGVEVDARVGRRGDWVEIRSIGFADQ